MADTRTKEHLDHLERHLTGARKVGLFGHRNVGKTTLLAMFYRQASAGKVPGLRLSAPEAVTAEYLAEKIARIESGESPAGTLAETELKLRLYHNSARYDLIVKDYQGEHITLGSGEPIMEFFADCDAVLLCLDPTGGDDLSERRRRQQEVETLLERYIDQSRQTNQIDRPIAMVITKYDLVVSEHGAERVEQLLEEQYGMTLHAVREHAPRSAAFAVSAYGMGGGPDGKPPSELHPMGLEAPLLWIAEQLEAIDREQLEWIWDLAPHDVPRLRRCLAAYQRRYPKSTRALEYKKRLGGMGRRQWLRRAATAAGLAGLLAGGIALYDLADFEWLKRRESSLTASEGVEAWKSLLGRHPHLAWYWPSKARAAGEKLAEWQLKEEEFRVAAGRPEADPSLLERLKEKSPDRLEAIAKVEQARDKLRHDERWKDLTADALIPGADPAKQLAALRTFLRDFPQTEHRADAIQLATDLQKRVEEGVTRTQRQQIEDLRRAATIPGADLSELIERTERFLATNPESPLRSQVEALTEEFAARLDDQDFRKALEYSKRYPTHYSTRLEKFQSYLQAHQAGGKHLNEAMEERDKILREWDLSAYRQAYDHFLAFPNDLTEVARRLNEYVHDHPDGIHAESARAYLDWYAKVSETSEYRVTLRRGQVEDSVGKSLAGGAPDLSVLIEVAGIAYGPSPVIPNSRSPIWDYIFPKPIAWKMGDPIVVKIIDSDWSDSVVYTLRSTEGDPLAIRLLSGTIQPSRGGKTRLEFSSDFKMPRLEPPGGG